MLVSFTNMTPIFCDERASVRRAQTPPHAHGSWRRNGDRPIMPFFVSVWDFIIQAD